MRLGWILFNTHCNKIPHRFRGKYRIVKKPSMYDLLKMRQDFQREELNMFYLRHPYLTVEQSQGHKKALCDPTKERLDKLCESSRQTFSKQITFAERLSHLGYGESWD